jgi:hypothetical protein
MRCGCLQIARCTPEDVVLRRGVHRASTVASYFQEKTLFSEMVLGLPGLSMYHSESEITEQYIASAPSAAVITNPIDLKRGALYNEQ